MSAEDATRGDSDRNHHSPAWGPIEITVRGTGIHEEIHRTRLRAAVVLARSREVRARAQRGGLTRATAHPGQPKLPRCARGRWGALGWDYPVSDGRRRCYGTLVVWRE
jgi:hypothetical protein